MLRKSEIENLAAGFRIQVIAEIVKYRGNNSLGFLGGFIMDIEAHRARYAEKIAKIRAGADAATIALADETERRIDDLARREIQRARAAGCVDFNPEEELPLGQKPPPSHVGLDTTSVVTGNVSSVVKPTMAAEFDSDKYASFEPCAPDKLDGVERVTFLNQRRSDAGPISDRAIENTDAVIRRATNLSLDEIDQVIHALQRLRDMVRKEGERVSREVTGYASLRHAAVAAMKIMADCIKEWQEEPDASPRSNTR